MYSLHWHQALLAVSLAMAVLPGCREHDAQGQSSESSCEPFDTRVCKGENGCRGGQMCNEDGSGWDPCDCGREDSAQGSTGEGATPSAQAGSSAGGAGSDSGRTGVPSAIAGAGGAGETLPTADEFLDGIIDPYDPNTGAGLGGAGQGDVESNSQVVVFDEALGDGVADAEATLEDCGGTEIGRVPAIGMYLATPTEDDQKGFIACVQDALPDCLAVPNIELEPQTVWVVQDELARGSTHAVDVAKILKSNCVPDAAIQPVAPEEPMSGAAHRALFQYFMFEFKKQVALLRRTSAEPLRVVVNISVGAAPKKCSEGLDPLSEHMTCYEQRWYRQKLKELYTALATYGRGVMKVTHSDDVFVLASGNSHFDISGVLKQAADDELTAKKTPNVLSERTLVVGTTETMKSRYEKFPLAGHAFSNFCKDALPACVIANNKSAGYGTSLAAPYVSAQAYALVLHGLPSLQVVQCLKKAHTIDRASMAQACGVDAAELDEELDCTPSDDDIHKDKTPGCPEGTVEDPNDESQCVLVFRGGENWCQRAGSDDIVVTSTSDPFNEAVLDGVPTGFLMRLPERTIELGLPTGGVDAGAVATIQYFPGRFGYTDAEHCEFTTRSVDETQTDALTSSTERRYDGALFIQDPCPGSEEKKCGAIAARFVEEGSVSFAGDTSSPTSGVTNGIASAVRIPDADEETIVQNLIAPLEGTADLCVDSIFLGLEKAETLEALAEKAAKPGRWSVLPPWRDETTPSTAWDSSQCSAEN